MNRDRLLDVIIIGAGPAGLTAATYLGRFRRPTLVIDAGEPRARWIPESHNTPGFPQGVAGTALLSRLREQALRYGSSLHEGTVDALDKDDGVGFIVPIGAKRFRSRFVILATGVLDQLPPIEGAAEAIRQGFLKICPICDAYEMIDKRIAIFGDGAHAAREAEFLRHFSPHVTLFHSENTIGDEMRTRLASRGIKMQKLSAKDLSLQEGRWRVKSDGGSGPTYDALYAALGCRPRNNLAARLAADFDESGALKVNTHQETSVQGLYAAGDVVRGLNQIVVAAAEGTIAAVHIHNRLR